MVTLYSETIEIARNLEIIPFLTESDDLINPQEWLQVGYATTEFEDRNPTPEQYDLVWRGTSQSPILIEEDRVALWYLRPKNAAIIDVKSEPSTLPENDGGEQAANNLFERASAWYANQERVPRHETTADFALWILSQWDPHRYEDIYRRLVGR